MRLTNGEKERKWSSGLICQTRETRCTGLALGLPTNNTGHWLSRSGTVIHPVGCTQEHHSGCFIVHHSMIIVTNQKERWFSPHGEIRRASDPRQAGLVFEVPRRRPQLQFRVLQSGFLGVNPELRPVGGTENSRADHDGKRTGTLEPGAYMVDR